MQYTIDIFLIAIDFKSNLEDDWIDSVEQKKREIIKVLNLVSIFPVVVVRLFRASFPESLEAAPARPPPH